MAESATAKALISVFPPHVIFSCDASIELILGYNPQQLVGDVQGIHRLCRNRPDSFHFTSGSIAAFDGAFQVVMCSMDGHERRIMINCIKDELTASSKMVRLITLATSKALKYSDIADNCTAAQVVVSAKPPHTMCTMNREFANFFHQPQSGVTCIPGQSLEAICGCSAAELTPLLLAAAAGQSVKGFVRARTALREDSLFRLRCAPVVSSDNQRVSLLAATFAAVLILPVGLPPAHADPAPAAGSSWHKPETGRTDSTPGGCLPTWPSPSESPPPPPWPGWPPPWPPCPAQDQRLRTGPGRPALSLQPCWIRRRRSCARDSAPLPYRVNSRIRPWASKT